MTPHINNDFPMLNRKICENYITYLDSAASSFKPSTVLEAERLYGVHSTSNVHRSHNALSEEVSYQYEVVRRKVAEFINSDLHSVIMTPNTSYALAMVAHGLQLSKNDTVLCSMMNHHSNLLPWLKIAKVAYFQSEYLEPLNLDTVIAAIKHYRPKVLAIGYISNVNGIINPIAEICKIARNMTLLQ